MTALARRDAMIDLGKVSEDTWGEPVLADFWDTPTGTADGNIYPAAQ
jgi:hypothetical protein